MIKNILVLISFWMLLSHCLLSKTPYVLLIAFDGFRWDYLHRGLTPNLDKLIANGVTSSSLKPCYPSSTFPNLLSIITGMYPENHGIISNTIIDWNDGSKYDQSSNSNIENKWYNGEAFWETARKHGVITASYFWPGSENELSYKRPNYYQKYEHKRPYIQRIDGVINWLTLPDSLRPHFITLYFDETDTKAHLYGTESIELNNGIRELDSMTAILLNKIEKINFKDSLNIIILSDHGMADLSKDKIINLKETLDQLSVYVLPFGSYTMIQPKKDEVELVYQLLKSKENHFKVYKKNDIPDYFHFKTHPFISDILIIAENGWIITNEDTLSKTYIAAHSYDNNWINMHGIFIANGPAFKSNCKTGTLENIDIYPLLCRIFGILPSTKIDGSLDRIKFILKDE